MKLYIAVLNCKIVLTLIRLLLQQQAHAVLPDLTLYMSEYLGNFVQSAVCTPSANIKDKAI